MMIVNTGPPLFMNASIASSISSIARYIECPLLDRDIKNRLLHVRLSARSCLWPAPQGCE